MTATVRIRLAAYLVCLLAFGLRLSDLTRLSFDVDEAVSAGLAMRPWLSIITDVFPDHPPFYYLLLHGWRLVAATEELSLRFPAVVFGVLLVPTVYQLGRRLGYGGVAVAAAVFVAISPFAIFHSQQVRPHILATLLGVVSVYAFVRAVADNRWRWWLVWLITTVAAMWTFYYTVYIPLAEGLLFVLFIARLRDRWRRWASFQLAAVALYLPWAVLALPRLAAYAPVRGVGLSLISPIDYATQSLMALSLGETANPEVAWPAAVPFAIVGVAGTVGLIVAARRRRREPLGPLFATAPLALLAVPLLGTYAVNVVVPHFIPRYLLTFSPYYALLLAVGLAPLERRSPSWRVAGQAWALAAVVVLAVLSFAFQRSDYLSQRYVRPDYRILVAEMASGLQPDDAIILNAPWQEEAFGFYYRSDNPIYGLPIGYPADEMATGRELQAITERHPGVWLVLFGNGHDDPTNVVEGWLANRALTVSDLWYGQARVRRFEVQPATGELPASAAATYRFGDSIELVGYTAAASRDGVQLTLYWRARAPIAEDYTVFVHVSDVAGRGIGQVDAPPVNGALPTSRWPTDTVIRDRRWVPLAPSADDGPYRVAFGLYRFSDMKRLPVSGPDGPLPQSAVLIGPLAVAGGNP